MTDAIFPPSQGFQAVLQVPDAVRKSVGQNISQDIFLWFFVFFLSFFLQELLSAISEFTSQRPELTLDDFLQDVALVSTVDELDDNRNAVTLMTLHSAKGLEFPVVFITGLEEGLLPLYSSVVERKELEEERRLCYVGITRAMKKLYFSYVRMRFRYGDVSYQSPSRFLEEVPKHLVEVVGIQRYTSQLSSLSVIEQTGAKNMRKQNVDNGMHYYSDTIPDYENIDESMDGLGVGKMVEHIIFGKGKILNLSGKGESLKAVVDFASVGRKNLLLKYAKLKVL